MAKAKKTMQVQLTRSPIGTLPNHKLCVQGLGLRKIGQIATVEDTASTRGMVNKVHYMVNVVGE